MGGLYKEVSNFLWRCFSFHRRKAFVAMGYADGSISLLNCLLQQLGVLRGHTGRVDCLQLLTCDAKRKLSRLCSGGRDSRLKLWRIKTGQRKGIFCTMRGHSGEILSVAECDEGLFASSSYGELIIWNTWSSQSLTKIKQQSTADIRSLLFLQHNYILGQVNGDAFVLWDTSSQNPYIVREGSTANQQRNYVSNPLRLPDSSLLWLTHQKADLKQMDLVHVEMCTTPINSPKITEMALPAGVSPRIGSGICLLGGGRVGFVTWDGRVCEWRLGSERLEGEVQVTPEQHTQSQESAPLYVEALTTLTADTVAATWKDTISITQPAYQFCKHLNLPQVASIASLI
ncbi:MAG: hypothetical protein GY800_10215 [Planctomycetes bacterium]|nr:hypothetical protein [Planctomycetota bacterium]